MFVIYVPFVIILIHQVETMFETYNFDAVFIQIQAVLTLYAQGCWNFNDVCILLLLMLQFFCLILFMLVSFVKHGRVAYWPCY